MKLASVSLFIVAALSGCKKSSQTATTSPTTSRAGERPAGARTSEPVTDPALREAILQLRRVHFGHDAATLLPASRDALARAAQLLSAYPDVHIFVDGHTDDRGTTEYNVALGDRRANAVVDYLVRMGIARDRLHAVTWGEERPSLEGTDAPARAMNRRVDFRLARGKVELRVEDGVPFADDGAPLPASTVSTVR